MFGCCDVREALFWRKAAKRFERKKGRWFDISASSCLAVKDGRGGLVEVGRGVKTQALIFRCPGCARLSGTPEYQSSRLAPTCLNPADF